MGLFSLSDAAVPGINNSGQQFDFLSETKFSIYMEFLEFVYGY